MLLAEIGNRTRFSSSDKPPAFPAYRLHSGEMLHSFLLIEGYPCMGKFSALDEQIDDFAVVSAILGI